MNKYPDTKIHIKGHADSRGTSKYNEWLSERRANRALEFVVSQGISLDRISSKGMGESQILNECVDGVICVESKHKENRRLEYILID